MTPTRGDTQAKSPTAPPGAGAARDPFIDTLRVAGVMAVILDHWLGAKLWVNDGRIGSNLVLSNLPQLGPATWLLVADPILFFAGGVSNAYVLTRLQRNGRGIVDFYIARAWRLLSPVALFLAAWLVVECFLHLFDLGGTHLIRGVSGQGTGPFGPLWFIVVYLAVIALCPAALWAHRRYGWRVLGCLAALAVGDDIARFALHITALGWTNLLVVWLIPHQLGFLYADGTLRRAPRPTPWTMCAAGLAGLILLPGLAGYPISIQGIPGAPVSNMDPPSAYIVAQTLAQVGAAILLEPTARRALQRKGRSRRIYRCNDLVMSMYVWHMTALLAAGALWYSRDLPHGGYAITRNSPLRPWALEHPNWLLTAGLLLAVATRIAVGADKNGRRHGRREIGTCTQRPTPPRADLHNTPSKVKISPARYHQGSRPRPPASP